MVKQRHMSIITVIEAYRSLLQKLRLKWIKQQSKR